LIVAIPLYFRAGAVLVALVLRPPRNYPPKVTGGRYSRRRFLGYAGAGALAAGATVATARATGLFSEPGTEGFGRMFDLPPFADESPELIDALVEIGRPGGILDAKDDFGLGAKKLFLEKYILVDDSLYRFVPDKQNPSTRESVAGNTFLSQFIAHDVTFDATSTLGRPADVNRSPNARTPALDLESVYGGGPALSPHLYDGPKLRIESAGSHEDVPRAADGRALISDPRNDQTAILAALHAAFLLFHNNAVDRVKTFERARRETTWHYQWLVLHEFLPHVVGAEMAQDVMRNGRRFFRPGDESFVPVEFAGAAFRFGHSMVRPSYRMNFTGDGGKPYFAFTFDPRDNDKAVPDDLRGGSRQERRFVDWESFFDFGDGQVGRPKEIDTRISTTLFQLPLAAIPTHDTPLVLPQRDLLRQVTWQLPSGQAIAERIGVEPLTPLNVSDLAPFGLERSTPLWYYVLKEAELREKGARLGPVGGRIVAETLIGLLELDPKSFLRQKPDWTPTFGSRDFGITDFLSFAGVHPRHDAA
jgi:Animal haem peroxidase